MMLTQKLAIFLAAVMGTYGVFAVHAIPQYVDRDEVIAFGGLVEEEERSPSFEQRLVSYPSSPTPVTGDDDNTALLE